MQIKPSTQLIKRQNQLALADQQLEIIKKHAGGRPGVIDEHVVVKLIAAFQAGMSDRTACEYAHISRDAYYDKLKKDQEFADQVQSAKNFQKLKAGQVINNALEENNAKVAMWLLERKEPEEFEKKPELVVNNTVTYTPPSWYLEAQYGQENHTKQEK